MVRPASGQVPDSLVILLHGYGSNGQDLIGLVPYWRDALPGALFLAPNAPDPCPGAPGGYQWWPLTDRSATERAAGVQHSASVLGRLIDRLCELHGVTAGRVALVGFSQGTMLALHVGPRREPALAGIVGFSGMLVDPDALAEEVRSKPPILLVHGDADPMVPFAALGEATTVLGGLGFPLSTHVSPGLGHGIDEAGIGLARQFLVQALA
jgi:phospholipase/carboxylesterase